MLGCTPAEVEPQKLWGFAGKEVRRVFPGVEERGRALGRWRGWVEGRLGGVAEGGEAQGDGR